MRARIQAIYSQVLTDFRATWKQLIAIDVAYKLASFALLVPFSGLVLRGFLAVKGTTVVADKDILLLTLSPVGVLGVIIVGAVGLAIIALEQTCLMVIGFGAARGVKVGFVDALWFAARSAVSVLGLTVRVVSRVLLIVVPFLATGALVFFALLTEFDINFYLNETPPIFWVAVGLIAAILVVLALVLVPRLIGWTFALPLLLFEGIPASQALRASDERTRGSRLLLATLLVTWAALSLMASGLAFGVIRLLGRGLVAPTQGRPQLLLGAIVVVVVLWLGAEALVTLLTASALALLIVRSYDGLVGSRSDQQAWSSAASRFGGAPEWRVSAAPLLAGLVAAGLAATLLGVYLLNSVRIDSDVEIIAHRGASGAAPENTLASMERAIADGADWVEIDVLETADGEVVVTHDRDLMRVAGVNLAIADATYEQLQGIDVGSRFASEFADQRVPRLADVLELCKGRVRVVIELKYFGRDERLEERVVEIVEAAGMESEVVVMSLNYGGVQKMRSLRPDWRLGLITAVAIGNLTRVDADFLAVNGGLATALFIRDANAAGKDVYVWPIYDRIEVARMVGRGADGIITNDPAVARRVLDTLAELSPVERLLVDVTLWMGIIPEAPEEETNDLEGAVTDAG